MEIIVGSSALDWAGLSRRTPIDIDIWTDQEEYSAPGKDIKHMPLEIMKLIPLYTDAHMLNIANSDAIYTIKCSHAVYDIKWEKTKLDILWLKSYDCKIVEPLYEALKAYWKDVHGGKDFLSLMKGKDEFFTDNVTYLYDHDYLHELVAYPDKPLYTKVLMEGQDVMIDRNKFNSLSFEDKVNLFREEITTIAAERWVINPQYKGEVSWYKAYMYSLRKTVTTLTKGWASEFIVLNLEHFVKPRYEDFKHLLKTLNLGENTMNVLDEIIEEYNKIEGNSPIEGNDYEAVIWLIRFSQNLRETHNLKVLEQEGGGEGGAEYCYMVFSWKDKIYKIEYSYQSYDGYDFDNVASTIREVKPVQKMVTVYE